LGGGDGGFVGLVYKGKSQKIILKDYFLNILVLTPIVPYPPHDGDKLRLYRFLKYLKSRGHVIDLFCLTRVKTDARHASDLQPLCRKLHIEQVTNLDLFFNLLGGALIGQSFNISSHFSPELRDALQAYWRTEDGKRIDVVLAHRLRTAPAAFEGNPGKPVVLELTDCLTAYTRQLKRQVGARFSRRLAAWWDYWFLRKEEAEWSEKAFQSVIISQSDAQVLQEQGVPGGKITVVPNGVEPEKRSKAKRPEGYPPEWPIVCFVGNMGYAPNEDGALWFLEKIWPQVKKTIPRAIFAAVGGQPREVLRQYHNGDDLLVTGWVPEVEPYVQNASISVAPLRIASGMQNKVAQSLSLGIPVVATSAAVSWLSPQGREGVIVADGENWFANEVIEALLNPKRARATAAKGKRFILGNYRWKESGKKLEEILKRAGRSHEKKF
jgi:polysaccharide biosynthesis protein PslH